MHIYIIISRLTARGFAPAAGISHTDVEVGAGGDIAERMNEAGRGEREGSSNHAVGSFDDVEQRASAVLDWSIARPAAIS